MRLWYFFVPGRCNYTLSWLLTVCQQRAVDWFSFQKRKSMACYTLTKCTTLRGLYNLSPMVFFLNIGKKHTFATVLGLHCKLLWIFHVKMQVGLFVTTNFEVLGNIRLLFLILLTFFQVYFHKDFKFNMHSKSFFNVLVLLQIVSR